MPSETILVYPLVDLQALLQKQSGLNIRLSQPEAHLVRVHYGAAFDVVLQGCDVQGRLLFAVGGAAALVLGGLLKRVNSRKLGWLADGRGLYVVPHEFAAFRQDFQGMKVVAVELSDGLLRVWLDV